MSKLLLLALAVLAILGLVAATQIEADFDSELALEAPELAEHTPDAFMTLDDLNVEAEPQASFAEIESEQTESEDAQPENEDESEAPAEEDAALVEVDAEAEAPWHRSDANQPVARNNAEITCLDGDCTRATKVRKAAVGTHPNANTKPPPTKLDVALGAVKEEIMVRAKELHKEKDWAAKVSHLIDEYQQKLQKVTGNIVSLRVQTKALLRKKKQIQNVQVQNKLRYKLKLAQADLNRLQKQMEHIAGKENEFADTEVQLKNTMNALKNSLLKLRGQEPKKLLAEGIDLPLP
jgi:uncharacterized protein YoxC